MTRSLLVLLAFQAAGEVLHAVTHLAISGPLLGMMLLFVALCLGLIKAECVQPSAEGLLRHLSILFLPMGVGISTHLGLLRECWPAVCAALLGSTLITIAVTGLVAQHVLSPSIRSLETAEQPAAGAQP